MAAVPYKTEYWNAVVYWMGNAYTKLNALGIGATAVEPDRQYDGQLGAIRALDYTGDSATWNPRIARFHNEYIDYVNTIAEPNGQISIYRSHVAGLLQDVLRATSRAAVSAQAIIDITNNAGYMVGDGGDPLTTQEYSREVAYALEALITFELAGNTLSGTQIARRGVLLEYLKGHFDAWANETGTFCKPFMVAISARTAIMYYQHVAEDEQIITKMQAAAQYIWDELWRESSGSWGAGQSFLYKSIYEEPGDDQSAPDLNAIISPMFGWLWTKTWNSVWRDRHNAIFAGGIPVYSGSTHISGAYVGVPANALLKQCYQQAWWAPDGITWAEMEYESGAGIMAEIPYVARSSAEVCGSIRGLVNTETITISSINTDITIFTPAADKFAAIVGWMYREGDAHILTFKSNGVVLDTLEQPANGGAGFPIDVSRPLYVSLNPGEALTVRSTVTVVPMRFTVIELSSLN